MPDWNDIFSKKGKVFTAPHSDMERIVRIFKNKRVQKVLDLGCGTGRHLIYLSKKGFDVYGFDASPKALSLATQWLEEENLNVELKLARMEEQFPYDDDYFDAIISIQVIHHNKIREILKTIGEIERILKKEGLIFITFPKLGKTWEQSANLKEVEKGTYVPQKGKEKGLLHHFFTIEEIHNTFSSFDLIKIYPDGKNHRAIFGIKK
ncbi:hypothetical protein LCGC14_1070740 [marine sediment metagenome]|uniref:Methyltransferase domain-containing protein n=1 Tax=marine sediment metagenome TaxID=412755 RepID=A0A0F9MN81_9ZZZZ